MFRNNKYSLLCLSEVFPGGEDVVWLISCVAEGWYGCYWYEVVRISCLNNRLHIKMSQFVVVGLAIVARLFV